VNAPTVARNRIIRAASIIAIVVIAASICSRKAGLEVCEAGAVPVVEVLGPSSVAVGDEVTGALAESRERSARRVTRFELLADGVKLSSLVVGIGGRDELVAHRNPSRKFVENVKLHRQTRQRRL